MKRDKHGRVEFEWEGPVGTEFLRLDNLDGLMALGRKGGNPMCDVDVSEFLSIEAFRTLLVKAITALDTPC